MVFEKLKDIILDQLDVDEDEITKLRMEEAAVVKKNGKKTAADKILERKQKKANKKGGSPQ